MSSRPEHNDPARPAGEAARSQGAIRVDLRTFADFGQEILSSMDLEDLPWTVVRLIHKRMGFAQAALGLMDPMGDIVFRAGMGGHFDDHKLWDTPRSSRSQSIGVGVTGRAAESARSQLVTDVSKDPEARRLSWLPTTGAYLAVPIVRHARVLGVISVFAAEADAFGEREVQQLEQLAPLIGVAVENAEGISRMENQNRQLQLVADVSRIAVGAPDVADLSARISAKLLEQFTADFVGLAVLDGTRQLVAMRGHAAAPDGAIPTQRAWQVGAGLAGRVAESGCTRVWNAEVEPNREDALLESSESEICVPLSSAGKTIGTLHLVSQRPNHFGPDDAQVLEAVAGPVAHALANVSALARITRLRNDLTGMIVHDVRNPLMIILTALKVLERVPTVQEDERASRYLRSAGVAGDDVMRLVGSLLDIQKLESGELSLHPVTFSMGGLVRRIVESNRIVAEVEQVTLSCEVDDDTPATCCDMDLMRRAVENLVGNAIKFTPTGGNVEVRVRPANEAELKERMPEEEAGVLVEVRDSGEGIPPEDQERIFEKFGVVESRRKRLKSSTGLGLALCKLVISSHRGNIWVTSEIGHGSSFRFMVPAVVRKPGKIRAV